MVSINKVRKNGRIAKRISDMHLVQKGLELYFSNNSSYPSTGGDYYSECASWGQTNPIPGFTPTYIQTIPRDPVVNLSSGANCYLYISDGNNYKFFDYNLTDMTSGDIQNYRTLKDPARGTSADTPCTLLDSALSLAVYSRGGMCW
jgi:hypothetical protein